MEQSCTVWHSGLTEENCQDLERIQKTALKIILSEEYKSYENALNILELEKLDERREILCLQFAKKCLKNEKIKNFSLPIERCIQCILDLKKNLR